ncbi:rho guanine nucleotide exchange factor 7 isoform X2 [Phlebotomus papatasi]|uniref:rho guanine nucleotide exchange factor 7 isoform X2 n=1 Tax=Phlebotomus papatasi TaxID=29031 RepID=UPI00248419DE|nr:rho guanine nucleotide exchange factor 7 isoform X2 [Phlebotomus papatasi]
MMETPYTVQAEYSFKGSNNDELCFKKGDIITVTQREEGGWWEGTLGDKTGWFPSNYVKEYKTPLPPAETIRPPEEIQASRSLVLNDLLESEKAHVAEIRGLLENFLEPLSNSQILSSDEYAQLMCNFVEIVEIHEDLLLNIEDCNDRVGKLFLSKASVIKNSHQAYCAAHPRAIVILDKYKDELETFMERQGAASPGLLVLTTGLSKPFRRLEKYSAMLQELERHMECGHPDRGDTQRSVAVYKDIASTCAATRRQKELELQVLTGPVRGWQGQELSTLGDIIHMGSVAVGPDHRDRYFVLFPQTLLILSVSQRMSAFIYEGKLPLTNITAKRLEDSATMKNAFELSAPLIERIVAVCQGPAEANKWVDLLSSFSTSLRRPGVDLKRTIGSNSSVNVPHPPPHMSPPPSLGGNHQSRVTTPIHMSQHKRSHSFNHHLTFNQLQKQQQAQPQHPHPAPPLPPSHHPIQPKDLNTQALVVQNEKSVNPKANWSITNLCPAPPSRMSVQGGIVAPRKDPPTYEEDALVLRVIESYCAAYQSTSRNTTHSVCIPFAGIEKEDRTPTLRQIWGTVRQMQLDIKQIKEQISEERALRNHLQQLLMGHLEALGGQRDIC